MTPRARRRFATAAGAALVALALAAGCTSTRAATQPLPPSAEEATSNPLTLLDRADRDFRDTGPVAAVESSLAAAEKALGLAPESALARLLVARAAKWLLEFTPDLATDRARELARIGVDAATALAAADPERAETRFLHAALLGYKMQHAAVPKLDDLKTIDDGFRKAAMTAPWIDQGGPLRAWGTLLVKSPEWPVGVGDVEAGVQRLREAVRRFPDHPANHYYLGQGLLADRKRDEARAELSRVLVLCEDARWGAVCTTYAAKARAELVRLGDAEAASE
jgi:tetratricopeptide (TPR) repeat protein